MLILSWGWAHLPVVIYRPIMLCNHIPKCQSKSAEQCEVGSKQAHSSSNPSLSAHSPHLWQVILIPVKVGISSKLPHRPLLNHNYTNDLANHNHTLKQFSSPHLSLCKPFIHDIETTMCQLVFCFSKLILRSGCGITAKKIHVSLPHAFFVFSSKGHNCTYSRKNLLCNSSCWCIVFLLNTSEGDTNLNNRLNKHTELYTRIVLVASLYMISMYEPHLWHLDVTCNMQDVFWLIPGLITCSYQPC